VGSAQRSTRERAYATTLGKVRDDAIASLERIGRAGSVDNHTLIRKYIVDLAVLATTARCPIGESSASPVVATGRTAALDYIASHFSDPELSLAKVAQSLRISP
jgi:hypothetical protein